MVAGGDLIGRSGDLGSLWGSGALRGFYQGNLNHSPPRPLWPGDIILWPVISKHSSTTVHAALNLAKVRDSPHIKGQEFPIFCLAIRADEKILKI